MSDARLDLLARQVDDLTARIEALEAGKPGAPVTQRCQHSDDAYGQCDRAADHAGRHYYAQGTA